MVRETRVVLGPLFQERVPTFPGLVSPVGQTCCLAGKHLLTDKTIVETGNVTPYLPLPEIRRRAQQSSPATVVTAPEGQ